MVDVLNVYDLSRRKTAILQNAFDITETHELNKIYTLSFQIPYGDEKVRYIEPFHYVKFGNRGDLYRIIKISISEDDVSILKVECEHVITTLIDELMLETVQCGGSGMKTSAVISYLLSKQSVKNWVLDRCDFDRKFEYLWEWENILNALYSIPKEFTKSYKWSFDTNSYPWKLSLVAIDQNVHPQYYIRAKRNLLSSGTAQDYADVCTRIYPLGYGEGVNQLTIKDVNGGKTYLESPSAIREKYGIKEKVLVDRRYENAESLKSYGQTVLDALQTPTMTKSFNIVDLYELTNDDIDKADVGDICKMTMDDTTAFVTKTVRVLDQAGSMNIELSTKATDIVSSIADLADRVRIEQIYSQGATQLYQHSKDANATKDKGMIMSLYFPSEMRQINKVLLRLKLNKFRSYSQTTESSKETIETNEVMLKDLNTTEAGGGTTESSGGTSVTVSGGSVSGGNTDYKAVSMNVSVKGTVSAPMETQTSQPNTNITSGTIWETGSSYVTAAYTEKTYLDIGGGYAKIEIKEGGGGRSTSEQTTSRTSTPQPYGMADDDHWHYMEHDHSININHDHGVNQSPHDHRLYGIEGEDLSYHRHAIKKTELSHSHTINHYHTVDVSGSASGGKHSHTFNVPNHSHTITAHKHKLPDLSHNHKITFNGHTHKITAGIFESGNATGFDIYVGGKKQKTIAETSYDGDITEWLLDESKRIPRDSWIDIEIRPNDLAYVVSSVFVQGFVQSRGDKTV